MRGRSSELFLKAQAEICRSLEVVDGKARFESDDWTRPDVEGGWGGGGTTRVLRGGNVFDSAGVNHSAVEGTMPAEMSKKLIGVEENSPFYATGISIVIHPHSPMVPTTHANYRYLEVGDKKWFGGGGDLTPYYLFEDDAVHFHRVIKDACDVHSPEFYPAFKKQCDEYFYLPHRGEARGIGGIFFDYMGKDEPEKLNDYFALSADLCQTILRSYLPIVERRKDQSFTPAQKEFQLVRRGRYVEFNLLYDRGTQFGLKTGGRTESILMSLPPQVKWEYCAEYEPGSREAKTIEILKNPKEWV